MGPDQFIFRPGQEVAGIQAESITAVKKAPSTFVTGYIFPERGASEITTEQGTQIAQLPLNLILFYIYSFIALILLGRFIYGIYSIHKRMKGLESISIGTTSIMLSENTVAPHSFMDTIFVNKKDYKEGLISDEIIQHEMAHIDGRHTLDILLVELLKIAFWFNPAIYLFNRAIKINHEYLADDRVLIDFSDVNTYQKQLLKATEDHSKVNLASNLNFYLTKKRLMMMTKSKSLLSSSVKIALLTPLIPILILFYNTRVIDRHNIKGTYETKLIAETVAVDDTFSYIQLNTEDGEPYSGSNKLFDPKTGILETEAIYDKGMPISIKTYNGIGQVFFRNVFDYENGLPKKQRLYISGNLFMEYIYPTPERDYQGIQRYWHLEEGKIQYEAHFLNNSENFHGLVTEFDTQGNIVEQERYEDGELVETIK